MHTKKGAGEMSFKSRVIMLAKAISVWWGIFLILGCCIGFSVNILFGLFAVSGTQKPEMKIFIPILISGSLVFSVAAYVISTFLSRLPAKKMRRKLDKTAAEKGICKDYTDILSANCRGDIKNQVCTELALSALVSGNTARAKEQLNRIDVISVLDVAQSTGNYTAAAYYYTASVLVSAAERDYDSVNAAYESGKFYINALNYDFYITAVKALALLKTGDPDEALKTAESASALIKVQPKSKLHLFRGLAYEVLAQVFFANGMYAEAEEAVLEAMSIKLTAEFEKDMVSLGREIKENSAAEV